jgi:hypothetical protein
MVYHWVELMVALLVAMMVSMEGKSAVQLAELKAGM